MRHDDREQLQELLRAVAAFEVRYGTPIASTQRPGVTCPIAPEERFDELKRLIDRASVFRGGVYSRREIPAHMTVAENNSRKASRQFDEVVRLLAVIAAKK